MTITDAGMEFRSGERVCLALPSCVAGLKGAMAYDPTRDRTAFCDGCAWVYQSDPPLPMPLWHGVLLAVLVVGAFVLGVSLRR